MPVFDSGPPNNQASSNPFGSLNSQKGLQPFGQPQSAGAVSTFSNSVHPFGQSHSASAVSNSVHPFGQLQPAAPISSPSATVSTSAFAPGASIRQQNFLSNLPARPSSTPLASPGQTSSSTFPPKAQPVQTHQTGSRNPFGPITKTPPPVPKAPTLMELAMGLHDTTSSSTPGQLQPSSPQSASATNTFSFNSSALNPGPTDMSSVASSFSFGKVNGTSGAPSHTAELSQTSSPTGSTVHSLFSSTLSTQPTGATSASSGTSHFATGMVKSHTTGFSGLRPFKPTSSFGAALLESLPPIPDNAPTPTNNAQFNPASPTTPSSASVGPLGAAPQQTNLRLNSQPTGGFGNFSPTGSTLGQGLRPQVTGGGVSNPFRASMMSPSMTGIPNVPSLPSSTPGRGLGSQPSFANLRVASAGGHLFGGGGSGLMANTTTRLQQQNTQSLI